ncbi:MAG TPA: hypothetical protein VGS20_08810 [Candidatus Acidoferrales bacterium]|nr:hypothetical protein [Candidatus Acidoferrales bacterium]
MIQRRAGWVAGLAGALLLAPASHAGTLGTDVIGLFPQNVGEFAYADMKAARQYKWFPLLEDQMLPSRFRQFERFLTAAGIDTQTQVEELAWGAMPASKDQPEEVLGVALGAFQPDSTEAYLKQEKLPTRTTHGYTLYAFGSGSSPADIFFFFLDSNTAVFGQGDAIDKLLAVRFGGAPSLLANTAMFPLIDGQNGQGMIWAVLDQHYTQLGLGQMMPEMESAGASAPALYQKVRAMILSVDTTSDVQTKIEAVCASPDDANNLAALLQAGLLYKKYQASQAPPAANGNANPNAGLAAVLDRAQVVPRGDRLDLDFRLTEDQIVSLIQQRVFAVNM